MSGSLVASKESESPRLPTPTVCSPPLFIPALCLLAHPVRSFASWKAGLQDPRILRSRHPVSDDPSKHTVTANLS